MPTLSGKVLPVPIKCLAEGEHSFYELEKFNEPAHFFQLAIANIIGCLTNIHSFQIAHRFIHVYLCGHVVQGR